MSLLCEGGTNSLILMSIEIVEYWAIMNRKCKPVRFFRNEERAKKGFERLRSEMKKQLFVAKYVIEVE